MLLRRRLKSPKYLLAAFICLFFIVFFLQYFNYDDIDVSYQLKKSQREAAQARHRPANSLDPNNSKFMSHREETAHQVSKAIDAMKRIVHLDLKGAQPKLAYLAELIPFFKRAGATGVLVEYEDFFPYEHDLEAIRNQNHYTKQEVRLSVRLARNFCLGLSP